MKTVRKNAKKQLEKIFTTANNIKVYSLNNNFSGEILEDGIMSPIDWLKKEYNFFSAKLINNENGTFTLGLHSNLWYQFEATV